MTLKNQLELLKKEWASLATKIKNKLQTTQQTLTDKTTQLQEINRKLELQVKEDSENEKFLEQLLKEFKELSNQL